MIDAPDAPDAPDADRWAAPVAGAPLDAVVDVPGSKSLTNRYLVLAALADGPGRVRGALASRDTLLMAEALTRLGAVVRRRGTDWDVEPLRVPIDGPRDQEPISIDCGLAGTVMRFLPPVAALTARPVRVDGDPEARGRPGWSAAWWTWTPACRRSSCPGCCWPARGSSAGWSFGTPGRPCRACRTSR